MSQIKKFIDRVTAADSKKMGTVVLTMDEARFLRDDLAKLLLDLHDVEKEVIEPTVEVVVNGGTFK
jgi:thymidine kinase